MLVEKELVDHHLLNAIRSQYRSILETHNRSVPGPYRRNKIDAGVVYYHLRQQGRIVDRAATLAADKKDRAAQLGAVLVDMQTDDLGFSEWYREVWTKLVADPEHRAAIYIQKCCRGDLARKRHAQWLRRHYPSKVLDGGERTPSPTPNPRGAERFRAGSRGYHRLYESYGEREDDGVRDHRRDPALQA